MTTNHISHVGVGTVLTQTEFEQASGHDLDGNFDLGANLLVGNGGSAGIAISANGEVNMASQPAVFAYNSAADANATGNGATATVDFDTEVYDQNADFASDTFTAPVTGQYLVCAVVAASGATTAATSVSLRIIASNRTTDTSYDPADNDACGGVLTAIIDMDAADTFTITFVVSGESSDVVDITGTTRPATHVSVVLVA